MNNTKVLALTALTAFLPGCTLMSTHEPVPGWPQLKVVEHHVTDREVRGHCQKYAPPLTIAQGCTIFFLDQGEAHIYVSRELPARWILEHERLHAAGYDHVGSVRMLRLLQTWKAAKASDRMPLE